MRTKPHFFPRLVSLLCLATLWLPTPLLAQTVQPAIVINRFQQNPNFTDPAQIGAAKTPGFQLDFDFTMLDDKNNVVTSDVDTATFTIADQDPYSPIPGRLTTPWRVVVVVDASATMANFSLAGVFKNLKSDISALFGSNQQTPVTYAVLKFDDVPGLVANFDTPSDQLPKNVQAMAAKQGGKSCLYDAVNEALTRLAGAQGGRQAVLVITASPDNCADVTQDAVIKTAQANHVQIYPVGISGFGVGKQTIEPLAKATGGITQVVDTNSLAFALTPFQTTLANQWNAKVTLFPKNGPQTGTLVLKLKTGQSIASPISFTADRDYPLPASIGLPGQVVSKPTGISFNVEYQSIEKIKQLKVDVISKRTGGSVAGQTFDNPTPTLILPTNSLVVGDDYTLRVTALDDTGQALATVSQDFKFQPGQLILNVVNPVVVTPDNAQIVVTIDPPQPEGVAKFKLTLTDGDNNPIPTFEATTPVGEPLAIAVTDKLPSGQYIVAIQALSGDSKVLAEVRSAKFSFIQPTWMDKLILFLKTNPLALAGIGALCCFSVVGLLAVVWFFVPKGGSKVKEVEIFVPEKQRRSVTSTSSGMFERDGSPAEPAPARREAPPARREPPPPPREAPPARREPPPPVTNLPPAFLSSQEPGTSLLRTPIRKSPSTVGRRDGNDIVLKVESASGVSGQHCSILFQNGQWFVLDEGSSYGTTVNGQTAPKGRPTPLPDGAIIGLGPKVKLQFRLG